MGNALPKPATYEDLLQVPEHLVAEILNGELHTHPRPSPHHARAASVLGGKLSDPFDIGRGGPGGWWILDEPEVHLAEQVIVPDLAGWRRERLPGLPDSAWIDLAPDWVCEILSPGTAKTDRTIKMPLYATHEVKWLWLIDPTLKTLEAFALHSNRWTLEATLRDSDIVALTPFEALPFPLSDLWP
jgi:Uma2 family endonuclease